MGRLRLLLIATAVAAACGFVRAQEGEITADAKASHEQIRGWLGSGEPRLVAWGAYFARANADSGATAAMVKLSEEWTAPEGNEDETGRAETNAMADVLDALIVGKAKVSVEGIAAVAGSFPNQALILASRLPAAEAAPLLMSWYGEREDKDHKLLARAAAMLLSKAPPPGFAASVVSESEEQMQVTVVSGNYGVGYGGSAMGSCGDGFGVSAPAGWPPLFLYGIEENSSGTHDPVLVRAGGDTVTYHRIDESTGWGSCSDPRPLTAVTRVHLVTQMLGGDEKRIPWAVSRSVSIQWENDGQFVRALQEAIDQEEAQAHFTVEDLFGRGFLSRDEADSVRPKLAVTVYDEREAGSPALPKVEAGDPRTAVTFPAE